MTSLGSKESSHKSGELMLLNCVHVLKIVILLQFFKFDKRDGFVELFLKLFILEL